MKINKYIPLTAMLFLSCITNTYAACTQDEINEFKRIEDDYKVTYDFNKNTKKYTLRFEAPLPDKYYYEMSASENIVCQGINETTIECDGFLADTYEIVIVGMTEKCNDTLKTTTLTLPKYNEYSEDPLCEGIEEFVLCNPTYDKEIDYDTFVSRVETYKRTKNKNENINNDNDTGNNNKLLNNMKTYIEENLIQIIIVTVFIILVVITTIITAKSIRKSRRLE